MIFDLFVPRRAAAGGKTENTQDKPRHLSTAQYQHTQNDPRLAVTANGVVDGSPSGDLTTSTGNIYVSKFTGAANQLWKLETGGVQVFDEMNIRMDQNDGETYSLSEGATWLDFCCPVKNFGETISWSSNNTNVATVDNNGRVTAKKAGKALIIADVNPREGEYYDDEISYYCTVYVTIRDGIYYLNNVSNDYRVELWGNNSYEEKSPVTVYDSGTDEPSELFRIFKFKHLGNGVYSIRSMLDNSMGWTASGNSLVCSTIGKSDSAVPSESKWRINSNKNGYYIQNVGDNFKYITSRGDPDEDCEIYLTSYSSGNRLQNWTINKITASYHGVTIKDKLNHLVAGETHKFKAGVYSTNYNTYAMSDIIWSVTDGTGKASIDQFSGKLKGISAGTVTVTATYRRSSYQVWQESCNVNITQNPDPLHFTNIEYIRYTRIPSNNTSHLLTIIKSSLFDCDIFIAKKYTQWARKNTSVAFIMQL